MMDQPRKKGMKNKNDAIQTQYQNQAENTKDKYETVQKSMRLALRNWQVLSGIFQYLEVKDLKSMRLVCKTWGYEATPLIVEETVLSIFNNRKPTDSKHLAKVDPRLIKNVLMSVEKLHNFPFKAVSKFFIQHNNRLEYLHFYVSKRGLLTVFNILRDSTFPALFYVGIDFSCVEASTLRVVPTFPVRQTLWSIAFRCRNMDKHNGLEEAFQRLIDSAPNLARLDIEGNFFPELSKCQPVGRFRFYARLYIEDPPTQTEDQELHTGEDPTFDIVKLNRMLDQMKTTLRHLTIQFDEDSYNYIDHAQVMSWNIPQLPKLELLDVDSTMFTWSFVRSDIFPELTSLSMKGYMDAEMMDNFISNSSLHVMHRVVTLGINYYLDKNELAIPLLQTMKKLFPKVESLELSWYSDDDNDVHKYVADICQEWKIQDLHLHIYPKSFPELLDFLELLPIYGEFLKHLRLTCDEDVDDDNDEMKTKAGKFMDLLLPTKRMESVVFENAFKSLDKNVSWKWIRSFIKENSLPIHFAT